MPPKLFFTELPAPKPVLKEPSLIFWMHGAFEHSGRYQYAMEFAAARGFNNVSFDFRGHGKSKGQRMVINSFSDYCDDFEQIYELFAAPFGNNVFLIAHSMGGLVALRALQEKKLKFKSVTLSSPFTGLRAEVPGWKKMLSSIAVSIYPRLSVPAELDVNLLSRNPEVGKHYLSDPLVCKNATAGWFESMMKACSLALLNTKQINVPVLMMLAKQDGIADNDASLKIFDKLSGEKQLKIWEGCYHELFNELNRDEILDYTLDYFIQKI